MKTNLRSVCLLALTLLLTAFSAHAQTLRLFVASYGSDSNNGSRLSPKRTFQAAHDAMSSGGDIVGLDTAGYAAATLNITKNISISMAPGTEGIVTIANGTNGIVINASLRVALRGLRIESTGASNGSGIYISSASSVEVDKCTITGFGAAPSVNTIGGIVIPAGAGIVVVTDTVIKDCPGSGITHGNSGPQANATLVVERCRLLSNGQGLFAADRGRVTVRDCTISNNAGTGIKGGGVGTGDVKVNVEHCAVTDNGTGILSYFGINVTVSNTAITGNGTGVAGVVGAPATYGNNQLVNNTVDGSFGNTVTQK